MAVVTGTQSRDRVVVTWSGIVRYTGNTPSDDLVAVLSVDNAGTGLPVGYGARTEAPMGRMQPGSFQPVELKAVVLGTDEPGEFIGRVQLLAAGNPIGEQRSAVLGFVEANVHPENFQAGLTRSMLVSQYEATRVGNFGFVNIIFQSFRSWSWGVKGTLYQGADLIVEPESECGLSHSSQIGAPPRTLAIGFRVGTSRNEDLCFFDTPGLYHMLIVVSAEAGQKQLLTKWFLVQR